MTHGFLLNQLLMRRNFSRRHSAKYRHGYTLIEILIASVLVAALMSAVWGMMSMYNSYLTAGTGQAAEQQLVRSLWQSLSDDLQSVTRPDSGVPVFQNSLPSDPLNDFSDADSRTEFETDQPTFEVSEGISEPQSPDDSAGDSAGVMSDRSVGSSTAADNGLLSGPAGLPIRPGEIRMVGTEAAIRLSFRKLSPDPFAAGSDVSTGLSAEDMFSDGIVSDGSFQPDTDSTGIQNGSDESLEGKAPKVPQFRTIFYQFQPIGTLGASSSSLASGLYRAETETLPLNVLLSQESELTETSDSGDEASVDRTTLETLLMQQDSAATRNTESGDTSAAGLSGGSEAPPMPTTRIDRVPEVVACQFAYFDGRRWRSSWDSSTGGNLPLAVRVRLRLASPQDVAALEPAGQPVQDSLPGLRQESVPADQSAAMPAVDSNTVQENPFEKIRTRQVERIILLQPVKPPVLIPGLDADASGDTNADSAADGFGIQGAGARYFPLQVPFTVREWDGLRSRTS